MKKSLFIVCSLGETILSPAMQNHRLFLIVHDDRDTLGSKVLARLTVDVVTAGQP